MRTHVKMADSCKELFKWKRLLGLCREEISRVRVIETLPPALSVDWDSQQRGRFRLIHSWAPLSQTLPLILMVEFCVFVRGNN